MRIFKGLFTKSLLKKGLERQFQHIMTNKKTRHCRVFIGVISWGICPKPRHKGLFGKSPLELQKLHQNEVVWSVESSLAYLSFKKGKLFGFIALFRFIRQAKTRHFIFGQRKIGILLNSIFSRVKRIIQHFCICR